MNFITNEQPHEFHQFSVFSETECAECRHPLDHKIHAVRMTLIPQGESMSNAIEERERIEMALSLGYDPDTSEPLTLERRAELEALLVEPTAAHPTAPGPQPTVDASDIQTLIQNEVAKAMGGISAQGQIAQPQTFEDVLLSIDPKDSDAALAMLDWLSTTGRLQNIGSINGGGYLFHYQEPKGSSKQGYTPGATKGGRMVDQAVDQARASGAKPRKTGLCDQCYSAVEQHEDGSISLDGDPTALHHDNGTKHNIN